MSDSILYSIELIGLGIISVVVLIASLDIYFTARRNERLLK
jgi:hypothetical protein